MNSSQDNSDFEDMADGDDDEGTSGFKGKGKDKAYQIDFEVLKNLDL